jgi:hypothetical protein
MEKIFSFNKSSIIHEANFCSRVFVVKAAEYDDHGFFRIKREDNGDVWDEVGAINDNSATTAIRAYVQLKSCLDRGFRGKGNTLNLIGYR